MEIVLKTFRKKKVLSTEQLTELLKCSVRTVQRRLQEWGSYRSFNKNGRFYVLPEISEFDRNGLWNYKGIFFSKYGDLRNTVISLVNKSEAGLSAKEIGELTGLLPRSFLSHFRDCPGIQREKHMGVYIYFAEASEIYSKQIKRRRDYEKQVAKSPITKLPSDADAVVILVQYIKHPDISIEELSKKVARKGRMFKSSVIRNFLEHHDLLKKTEDTRR